MGVFDINGRTMSWRDHRGIIDTLGPFDAWAFLPEHLDALRLVRQHSSPDVVVALDAIIAAVVAEAGALVSYEPDAEERMRREFRSTRMSRS